MSTEYYVVSPRKFNYLYYFTLGIYAVYWSYRHWQAQKEANGLDIWPVPRGLFLIFFTHSLLRGAAAKLKQAGKAFDGDPETLANIIVLLLILSNVSDRLASKEIWMPYSEWVSLLLLPFLGAHFLKAQRNLNLAAGDAAGLANDTLSVVNKVWIAIGAVFWLGITFLIYAEVFRPEWVR